MLMRLATFIVLLAAFGVAACGLETRPADPNMLLPTSDRPPPGPGLFSGDDGIFTIPID